MNIAGDHVKDITEVHADGISSSSIVWQCIHPITEGHSISQALFALDEAKLAVSKQLPVFHLFWCTFQEDCSMISEDTEARLTGQ